MDARKLEYGGLYIVRGSIDVRKIKIQEVTKTTYMVRNMDKVADDFRIEISRFAKEYCVLEKVEQI